VLLVDQNGKIVFIGHPSERNLEEDINLLLKGEKLSGTEDEAKDEEETSAPV